jgi:hypothetical protein
MDHLPRILLLCPQGGISEAEFAASIGNAIQNAVLRKLDVSVVCLRRGDADSIGELAPGIRVLKSFEEFQDDKGRETDIESETLRLARDYVDVNWWAVAAGERSFIDSSFLLGGLGQRTESREYVESLIVNLVVFFEQVFSQDRYVAVLSPVADSLIIHVLYNVARQFGVSAVGMTSNAWIREDGRPGFFFMRDEYLHSDRMENAYRELDEREMSEDEQDRVRRFKQTVIHFDVDRTFRAVTKRPFIVPAVSPNLKRLPQYLRENARRRVEVEYYKIDIMAKAKANVLRAWRRWRSKHLLGPKTAVGLPRRSVFYPMQYQPEQTTLVGGIYFANQIAVIENIAKSLPFGYTLTVKEHPRGRGARPAWQYRHLAHFPNIQFCDAPGKSILSRCEAVITITGTVGLEAMAMDKPVIVLGNCYYDFVDFVYRPQSWPELAQVFRRILIDREYDRNSVRHRLIDRFFLSYLIARVPELLSKESAVAIASAACVEIDFRERHGGHGLRDPRAFCLDIDRRCAGDDR